MGLTDSNTSILPLEFQMLQNIFENQFGVCASQILRVILIHKMAH